jgi:hypothetical protein
VQVGGNAKRALQQGQGARRGGGKPGGRGHASGCSLGAAPVNGLAPAGGTTTASIQHVLGGGVRLTEAADDLLQATGAPATSRSRTAGGAAQGLLNPLKTARDFRTRRTWSSRPMSPPRRPSACCAGTTSTRR